MLDRESTFADKVIVELLKDKFVPVAIDQWFTRRQEDTEGDFWRKIASQSPRNDFSKTTQGLFIVDASGNLVAFNNNRGPDRIREQMLKTIANYKHPKDATPIVRTSVDPKYSVKLPADGIVVRVAAQVTGGYETTDDPWRKIFQKATSRDNLWITKEEIADLQTDKFPENLAHRIERFHLLDNTRGEPSVWTSAEIKSSKWSIKAGKITGNAILKSTDGKRGFEATTMGEIAFDDSGKVISLNLFTQGDYWGSGAYTLKPPVGKFPLAIAFSLADGSDIADPLAPHASRGWLDGYLKPKQ